MKKEGRPKYHSWAEAVKLTEDDAVAEPARLIRGSGTAVNVRIALVYPRDQMIKSRKR